MEFDERFKTIRVSCTRLFMKTAMRNMMDRKEERLGEKNID